MLPGARNVPGNPFNMDPSAFCQNQVRFEWAAVRRGEAFDSLLALPPSPSLSPLSSLSPPLPLPH